MVSTSYLYFLHVVIFRLHSAVWFRRVVLSVVVCLLEVLQEPYRHRGQHVARRVWQ